MTPDQPSERRYLAEQASNEMERIESLPSDNSNITQLTIDPKKLTELVIKLNGLLDPVFQA